MDASFIYNETFILTEVLNIGIHCVKSVHIRSFLVRVFPHEDSIRKDTSLYSSEYVKIRERKTPNTDTFHAVIAASAVKKI